MRRIAVILGAVLCWTTAIHAQTHPRLFFGPTDVAGYRAKASTAPWSGILSVTENAATADSFANSWFYRPHYYAVLELYKGDTSSTYATKARDLTLEIISSSWWQTSGNALDRGTAAAQVAVAYDLCYNAWVGQTVPATVTNPITNASVTVASKFVGLSVNAAVSLALKENGDNLIASGGSGWPGDASTANNWHAVRYGGAGLCYLATDDTVDSAKFNTAATKLKTYFQSNLGSGADSRGWNVEGIGYLGFPGQTSMPFVLALQRNANASLGASYVNKDLRADVPGLKYALQTLYPGALPITRRHPFNNDFTGRGLRPEFNDDHPLLMGEGTGALAFALAPDAYKPALKWSFRRLWGDLGDQTWDMVSGNALWALLYYPDALAEQNPADVWGLSWKDPAMGMFVLRNRYQDENDTVFQATANLRLPNGGHGGPDDLSFRLWSLGVPWVVGAGRNYDNEIAGQTTLAPSDPSTITSLILPINNSVSDTLLRAAGDGYLIFKSDQLQTGSTNVTRRYAVDYNSAQTGAASTVIVSDTTGNPFTYWRMNTPSFNTITTDDATRTFTLTSPDGKTMRGKIIWPTTVTFRKNSSVFDRTHVRFPYKDINYNSSATNWVTGYSTGNNWVDFQTTDGKVVVVLTVVDNGGTQPTVSTTGNGNDQVITVGSRVFTLAGDSITATGWERPNVAITSPTANQNFNAGATPITLAGTAGTPSGSANTLDRVEIYLDDVKQGNATLSGGTWSYTIPSVAVGTRKLSALAIDSAKNERRVDVSVKVNNSVPPKVSITWPGPTQQFYDQQTVTLRGTVSDPDGSISKVEIYWAGTKLGDATLGTGASAGTWTYNVSKRNTGTYKVYARAIDNSTDSTDTPELSLTFSRFFSNVPVYGDAGRYSASATDSNRWTTYVDAAGNTRLRVRETPNTWSDLFNQLPSSTRKNWRLTYKSKSDLPLTDGHAYYMVGLTGDNKVSLVMMPYAATKGPAWALVNGGTRVVESKANGFGILPTLKWHPTNADGSANSNLTVSDPRDTNGEYRGIPNDGWNDVRIDKTGPSIKVWVNDFLIMDGSDARLNLAGPVSLSGAGTNGESGYYGNASFDDVAFIPLDETGTPLAGSAGSVSITAPAASSALTSGANATVSGSVTDADGIASVEVFSGSTKLGNATVTSGTWSYAWNSVPLGTHALWARLTDTPGNVTDSAPVTVFAGTGTGNIAPSVTIGQNASVAAPNFGLTGSVSDGDGSITLVQVFRDGNLLGAATVSGGTWTYTVSGVATGSYTFAAKAFDNLGASADTSFIGTVDGNAPPTISDVANQTVNQGQVTGSLAFTVSDDTTAVGSLTVTATSSNQTLVPNASITLGGSGGSRTVQVSPVSNQSGVATITLTVSDGAKTASDLFTVTVNAPPVASTVAISPATASVPPSGSQQFTAVLNDQYGAAMASQPSFTWSVSGGGSINGTGLFTAGATTGTWQVTATGGGISGMANFSVSAAPPANLLVKTGFEGYAASGGVAGTSAPVVGDIGIASDTWAGSNWSWQGSGLSYTNADGTIDGGSRSLNYTGSTYQFRQVNVSPTTPVTQTVFIRFLVKLASAPGSGKDSGAQFVVNNDTTNTNNNRFPGFGIWSVNGNANDFFVRNTNGTETYFGGKAGNTVHLMVGKLTWSGSAFTQLDVWADPVYGNLGSPNATVTLTTPITSLSELVFRGGSLSAGPTVAMDELIISTGWSGVVPSAAPVSSSISVSPATASVAAGAQQQLTATVLDQFGAAISPQPALSWSVSGGGTINSNGNFSAGFTPGGPHTVTVTSGALSGTSSVTVVAGTAGTPAIVTYAGAAGIEEFKDVFELSDGTVLVSGSAENLDWISATKTQLSPLTIPNRSTGRTAFLMRLASNLQTVLGVWYLPSGQVLDFRWIKSTSKPGAATGAIYVSGASDATSGDYFIARLNGDFINTAPTAFSWVITAKAAATYGDNLGLQTWDVGGDGRVAYLHESGEAIRVFFANASGAPLKLSALRGSHWVSGATLNDANRQAGIGSDLPATSVSGISFPADLRSWTEPDRLAVLPDENGQIKRGTWPLDLFTAVQDKNGGTSGTIEYGYTGYKSMGKFRVGGIAINRETNDLTVGFNIQSAFWDTAAGIQQPDFEPAVISYGADGALKWWSRLYHEVVDANSNNQIDAGETLLSSPDQYVDGLAIDYSTSPARVVVNARCHGNNTSNFWKGNAVASHSGSAGFQNQFTGTDGNIHIGWIGKLRQSDGQLQRASYLSGYQRATTLTQSAYSDTNLDGWPSHNLGWPNLTTTKAEPSSVRTDSLGRVYIVGIGPRMVTTATAWQKLPKITNSINEGISPWAAFARVFDNDLVTLVYSTALTGAWTYPSAGDQPEGADNTDLYGIFPTSSGLLTVGRQRATSGLATGNAVPLNEVPGWGASSPSNVSALFARLPFAASTPSADAPVIVQGPDMDPNPVTGTQAVVSSVASDTNDGEAALTYTWSTVSNPVGGSATFTANGTNAANNTTVTFTRAGTYGIKVVATDPGGKTGQATTNIVVSATPTSLSVSPATVNVNTGANQTFTATVTDQFGQAISGQAFSWSVSGGGTINGSGVFTAGTTVGGPHTVTASLTPLSATAQISITAPIVPEIDLPATSVSQSVQTGGSTNRPFRIRNLGNTGLAWNASAVVSGAGATGGNITTFTTSSQTGGPAFSWADISSGATTLWAPSGATVNDDEITTINFPSGFTFSHYGTSFSAVRVSTNGYLTFNTGDNNSFYGNQSLPGTSGIPTNFISVLWTDWKVDSSSWLKWKAVDNDTLVITWNNVLRFGQSNRATFQVILKRSGDILVQVKSFAPTDRVYTIGIQNSTGTTAVLAAHNPSTAFVPVGTASNFAVRFVAPVAVPNWLDLSASSGTTAAGGESEINFAFNSAGLAAGTYYATLSVTSNDTDEASLQVPVTLTVTASAVVPNAPSGLTASAASASQVNLVWKLEGASPTGHRADYRIVGNPAWTTGPAFGAAATSGSVNGLVSATAYEFRVVATNAAGDSPASNIATATTPDAYAAWIAGYPAVGPVTGETQDPDRDGIPNLLEFALNGGNPAQVNTGILPAASITTASGSDYLTLTVNKNPAASGITYSIEVCSDLATWNSGPSHTTIVSETSNTIVGRDNTPLGGAAVRRFIRLKVSRP